MKVARVGADGADERTKALLDFEGLPPRPPPELDKLLDLQMIPPTVEKRVKGELGAAVMWVKPVRSFKELGGPPTPPPTYQAKWNRQLLRAKMFDCLIYNKDPNLGNWLVDPAWNLILIDHTRSFTSDAVCQRRSRSRSSARMTTPSSRASTPGFCDGGGNEPSGSSPVSIS